MKKIKFISLLGLALVLIASTMLAQENKVDRATVPFSDPSQPGEVHIRVFRGGITVTGYSGKEVIVEAAVRGTMIQEKEDEEVSEKARGMRLIRSSSTGLTITEENNVMNIGSQSLKYPVDISVQVPFRSTLKLGGFNEGDIVVEKITGELEISNHNGSITLTDITGSVVANTFNGELNVTFAGISPDKPMSFSTWNGDVDVTLPRTFKGDVKMRSEQGDIYSDFDVQIKPQPQGQNQTEARSTGIKEGEKFKIAFDKTIYGAVNGGGPEFSFKTFNGDIYIRKK